LGCRFFKDIIIDRVKDVPVVALLTALSEKEQEGGRTRTTIRLLFYNERTTDQRK